MSFPRPRLWDKNIKAMEEWDQTGMPSSQRRRPDSGGSTRTAHRRYSLQWGEVPASVAPYVPTPISVIRKMLELAKASVDDVVFDLGCGDGRILFTAVEEYDVKKAVGYELNPSMYETVRLKVDRKGLQGRIEVVNGNFFLADLSGASLITLYLTTSGNAKLRPKFERELRGGARVVSHDFPVQGWVTVRPGSSNHYTVGSHRLYLYRVPGAYDSGADIRRSPGEESRWRRIRDIFVRYDDRG